MKRHVTPLSDRIAGTAPIIKVRTPGVYLAQVVRRSLLDAVNEGRLSFNDGGLSKHVRLDAQSKLVHGACDLVGGRRNFKRVSECADLLTPDGGWLFFAAIMQPRDNELEIVAYNVERVYGGPDPHPRWIRFDYNEPGHDNDERGLRAHFHPGNDDIQLPSPIFALHELIDLLLAPPTPRGARKARTKSNPT